MVTHSSCHGNARWCSFHPNIAIICLACVYSWSMLIMTLEISLLLLWQLLSLQFLQFPHLVAWQSGPAVDFCNGGSDPDWTKLGRKPNYCVHARHLIMWRWTCCITLWYARDELTTPEIVNTNALLARVISAESLLLWHTADNIWWFVHDAPNTKLGEWWAQHWLGDAKPTNG